MYQGFEPLDMEINTKAMIFGKVKRIIKGMGGFFFFGEFWTQGDAL
jgi:hypothetical protein